jgi:hypothetical protein
MLLGDRPSKPGLKNGAATDAGMIAEILAPAQARACRPKLAPVCVRA